MSNYRGIFVYTKAIGFSKLTSWRAAVRIKGKIDKKFLFERAQSILKAKNKHSCL